MKEETREEIEYDHCPHCYGSFSFKEPVDGKCCWCGKALGNSRYAVKAHKARKKCYKSYC